MPAAPRPRASRCRCGRPGASRLRWHRRSRWADRQPAPDAGRHGPAAGRRTRCPRTPESSSPPLLQERQQVIEHPPALVPVGAAGDVEFVLPSARLPTPTSRRPSLSTVECGQLPGQVRWVVVERVERAGVQSHPAGRRGGDRPQQHRIEITGHLRRVGLLFARIGGLHVHRREQSIGDPQRVVAKVLQRAAERAQASGAIDRRARLRERRNQASSRRLLAQGDRGFEGKTPPLLDRDDEGVQAARRVR